VKNGDIAGVVHMKWTDDKGIEHEEELPLVKSGDSDKRPGTYCCSWPEGCYSFAVDYPSAIRIEIK
jgi:hypothetical protein